MGLFFLVRFYITSFSSCLGCEAQKALLQKPMLPRPSIAAKDTHNRRRRSRPAGTPPCLRRPPERTSFPLPVLDHRDPPPQRSRCSRRGPDSAWSPPPAARPY